MSGPVRKMSWYGSSARMYAASSAARSPPAKRRPALAPAYGKRRTSTSSRVQDGRLPEHRHRAAPAFPRRDWEEVVVDDDDGLEPVTDVTEIDNTHSSEPTPARRQRAETRLGRTWGRDLRGPYVALLRRCSRLRRASSSAAREAGSRRERERQACIATRSAYEAEAARRGDHRRRAGWTVVMISACPMIAPLSVPAGSARSAATRPMVAEFDLRAT